MRLCLVALNAYPAIDSRIAGPIGGIETRSWLLARGLAARPDCSVQFVVRHHEALLHERYDGVQLIPWIDALYPLWQSVGHCLDRRRGFPWVRVKRWDPRLLWRLPRLALDRLLRGKVYSADAADPRLIALSADIYATFGVQTHSAVVIRSARAAHRPAVLFLGSDGDLDPNFEPSGSGTDPYGTRAEVGREILRSANLIIAQTPEQQARLKERFGLESELLANPIDVAAWDTGLARPANAASMCGLERYVLWVGRAEEIHKRPQLCVEIARQLPEVSFLMVLNPRDDRVEAQIRANAPANVRIVERVAFDDMPALFAHAAAFLNTSHLEGFPNVFLQGALSRVPIVALDVGKAFLTASAAGVCADGDIHRASRLVAAIWRRETIPGFDATSARRYVIERHALPQVVERLHSLLRRFG